MALADFLRDLFETGEVQIHDSPVELPETNSQLDAMLRTFYQEASLEVAGEAPDYVYDYALAGAMHLYGITQCLVMRDWDKDKVDSLICSPFKDTVSSEAIFCHDLTLRYLPDTYDLAKSLAPGDPMLQSLVRLGGMVPLSSIGIDDVSPDPEAERAILAHEGLRRLYADRILQHKDTLRLADPNVQEAVIESTGAHSPFGEES